MEEQDVQFEPDFSAVLVYDPKIGMNQGWLFPDWHSASEYMQLNPGLEAKAFLMAALEPPK